jgi:ATP-dependent DNA helicase RecG
MLHRADYIEKMGTGVRKMQRLMSEAGLAPLEFAFTSFFTVTFRKPEAERQEATEDFAINFGANFGLNFGIKGKRLARMVKMFEILRREEMLIDVQIAETFEVSERTIDNDIRFLRGLELIEFIGAKKTGRYVLTEKGKKIIENTRQ